MAHNNTTLQNVKPYHGKKVSIVSSDTEYLIPVWCMDNVECYYDEYVQFELKNKEMWDSDIGIHPVDTGDETCLSNYIHVEKTFCYLCNVQIPLPYINEHQQSSKHLTHRKIAEIGTERIKNQMTQNYYLEAPPPSMYFCSTCDIVIAEIDKKQHLKSKSHKNAAMLDKMLNDFLKYYTNYETEMDDETEPENVLSQVDNYKIQTKKLAVDAINNNNAKYRNFNTGKDVRRRKNFFSNSEVNTPAESSVKQLHADTNLEQYIKYLNSIVSTYRLEYVDGFYLKIKTEDDISFKVKHENYHGLVGLGKRHVQCKLCMLIVRDMKEHMLSSQHIVKLQLPINNHYIRKLDDTKNHCVICNDIIDKPVDHALFNKTHDQMLMNALNFDTDEKEVNYETFKTQSKVSDGVTNRNNKTGALPKTTAAQKVTQHHYHDAETFKGHERTVPRAKVKATEERESKDVVWGSDVDDWFHQNLNIHYHLECTPMNELNCKICNITFPINKSTEHLLDKKHINAYDALIVYNCLKKLPEYFYCQICDTYMSHGKELDHIISPTHVVSPLVTKSKNNLRSVNASALLMRGIEDPLSGIKYHVDNKRTNNGQSLHSRMDKLEKTDNAGSVFGNTVSNAAVVQQTHSHDNTGAISFNNIPQIPKAKKKNKAVVIKNDTNVGNSTGENQIQKLGTDSYKNVCKVCSITIPGDGTGIKDHVSEGYHRTYVHVIARNRLKIVGNVYYCELCHNCVSIGQHFNHMHEQSHVHYLNTLARSPGVAMRTDLDTSLDGDLSTITAVPLRKYPYYEMMKTNKPGEYKCQVCAMIVPKKKQILKSHVEDMKHRKLMQELLTGNLVMELCEYFNCCLCCVKVPKENLFEHVNDDNHKKMLLINQRAKLNLKGTLVCYLCNMVNTPNHSQGLLHLTNMNAMAANNIVVTGEICFCVTCNVYFICKFIESHLSTLNHLAFSNHSIISKPHSSINSNVV